MELKHTKSSIVIKTESSLNRTFYGIETTKRLDRIRVTQVLIVPFMELKLRE